MTGVQCEEPVAGFAPHAKWRQLENETNPVPDPRKNSTLVGPTVPEGQEEYQKFNFSETFDRPPFVATSPVIELIRKQIVKDRRTGEPKYRDEIREQG